MNQRYLLVQWDNIPTLSSSHGRRVSCRRGQHNSTHFVNRECDVTWQCPLWLSMVFRKRILLFLLVPFVTTSKKWLEIGSQKSESVIFPSNDIYGLIGPGDNPVVCLNISFERPMEVSLGDCYTSIPIRSIQNKIIHINRSQVDHAFNQILEGHESCEPNQYVFDLQN